MQMSEDEGDEDEEDEDYPCKNIWTILLEESMVEGVDMLEDLEQHIYLSHSLQEDEIYQVVMKITENAMNNKDIDFDDALDYAVEKEKDLIFMASENARMEARLEGKAWATMEMM